MLLLFNAWGASRQAGDAESNSFPPLPNQGSPRARLRWLPTHGWIIWPDAFGLQQLNEDRL